MYTLKNEFLTVQVSAHGAEHRSIRDNKTGIEYLWQADAKYWGRSSPILFPFVGGSKDGHYRVDGVTYPMTQHGFARDMEFKFESLDKTEEQSTIRFLLESHDHVITNYPYNFDLLIGYTLRGREVTVTWEVVNCNRGEMLFGIGAHPAFNCPPEGNFFLLEQVDLDQSSSSYRGSEVLHEVKSRRIVDGLASDIIDVYQTKEGYLPIHQDLFQYDALVVENNQVQRVSITDENKKPYITVTFDMPLVGLWSPPGKNAPFVCIEPWMGRCDALGFEGELKDRAFVNVLKEDERFEASYVISV